MRTLRVGRIAVRAGGRRYAPGSHLSEGAVTAQEADRLVAAGLCEWVEVGGVLGGRTMTMERTARPGRTGCEATENRDTPA